MDRVFVVQLQNRPGALADLVRSLAGRGINIERVASGGTESIAFACLQTDDSDTTNRVLSELGLEFVTGHSVVVALRDEPGSLAAITTRLADAGINVRSVMTLGRCDGDVEVALVVDDSVKARETLGRDAVLVG